MGACRELDSGRVPKPRARTAATLALTVAITFGAASAVAPAASADPGAQAKPKKKVTLTVCKHGCRFRTINSAVRRVRVDKRTTIMVKPGTYREGVRLFGRKFDGLKIMGTGATPDKVVLEGDRDGDGEGDIQNAIEAVNASHVKLLNMRAQNYATNGFFIHADPGRTCDGFLMKKLEAAFNRSYGLFARNCIGGRITRSEGWGHGDSAFYIGETPPQRPAKREWTQIDHVVAHTNVLGYSGTNSKYVDIRDSYFFNNGAGVVPNTLDSERFEPSASRKDPRQLDLLEQLQLLQARLAGADRVRRSRRAAPGARRGHDQLPDGRGCGAPRLERLGGRGQRDLRELQVGRGPALGSVQRG